MIYVGKLVMSSITTGITLSSLRFKGGRSAFSFVAFLNWSFAFKLVSSPACNCPLNSDIRGSPNICVSSDMRPYQLRPLKLGAEVFGIDLKNHVPDATITQIKKDVTEYKLLVFRNQGRIDGNRHVAISLWFGNLESTFYKHSKSPHPDIFRVSNDPNEGCTGVGRTGWHIDGSFQPAPFAYSIYHIWHVPKEGDTVFASLTDLIDRLDHNTRERWEKLWMVSDRQSMRIQPLIYAHPITKKKVLCFHLGMTEQFVRNYGTPEEKHTDKRETYSILEEILYEFLKNNKSIQYSHKWCEGDFIISDNLAVGHEASPETQKPKSEVGLRVMHRTTIQGVTPPSKET